jgi:hypothetical protein
MNMKKTIVASALAVAMGGASAVQANTAGLTGVWTGSFTFSMFSPNGGAVGAPTAPQAWTWDFDAGTVEFTNTTTFYASVWTAHDTTITDDGSSYGPSAPGGVNVLFDWSVNINIPVTSDWDVTASGNAAGDTATVTVNSVTITAGSPAFPGFHPNFSGDLTKVPVPAAAWLMGSGLIGLVGVARRRKKV